MSSPLKILNNLNIHLHIHYKISETQEMEIDSIDDDRISYTIYSQNYKSKNVIYWGCFRATWLSKLQEAA